MMDAPETQSWRQLMQYAEDRDYWRTRVRQMKQPRVAVEQPRGVTVDMGSHFEKTQTLYYTVSA